jgi:hypothetical protein
MVAVAAMSLAVEWTPWSRIFLREDHKYLNLHTAESLQLLEDQQF